MSDVAGGAVGAGGGGGGVGVGAGGGPPGLQAAALTEGFHSLAPGLMPLILVCVFFFLCVVFESLCVFVGCFFVYVWFVPLYVTQVVCSLARIDGCSDRC
mmetsp:Transcript_13229/g.15571  ORF Transcript_13229/g.15571 Transcript_13229/m.15571 type:complete len:100 (+) Transcript_13229:1808-2107(+)